MPDRKHLCLVHWNEQERNQRAEQLRGLGFEVRFLTPESMALKKLREDPPAALVIDLTRLPSHGREVALAVRQTKSLQAIPIVFAEGDPAKVDAIRKALPDATYATWRGIGPAIKQAMRSKRLVPAAPTSSAAGYSATPLPKKLGIQPGFSVLLLDAPKDFDALSDELPSGVTIQRLHRTRAAAKLNQCDLALWFVKQKDVLEANIGQVAESCPKGGLWLVWPKQASGVPSDLRESVVQKVALNQGLVDVKVCAVDSTWSGLKFVRRKS